jgi:hypothetical protein
MVLERDDFSFDRNSGADLWDCFASLALTTLTGHCEEPKATKQSKSLSAGRFDLNASRSSVVVSKFAKHLKALRWRTPFEAISDAWTNDTRSDLK